MPSINSCQRNPQKEQQYKDCPALGPHKEKILIVAKTAPNPSDKYRETVCTAGITQKGKWIRLYPIPFRYMEFDKWFHKYQWIEVEIEKRPADKDFRIDSYQPNCDSIKPLGKPLKAENWKERKEIILPTSSKSLEEIREMYDNQKVSLGIFKPKRVTNFVIEPASREWSKKHKQVLSQQHLFDQQPKALEKIPYNFSYEFECNDSRCKGHKMQIIDWEITELYRNMKKKYPFSMDTVLEKVKNQWFYEMCGENKDTHLIVGSVYPKPSFVVLGVFWPPK